MIFRLLVPLFMLLTAACSTQHLYIPEPDTDYLHSSGQFKTCASLYVTLDKFILKQGQADVQNVRIKGFPYLRVNRFLSSFRTELTDEAMTRFWVTRLAQLDYESRLIELQNIVLSDEQKHQLGIVDNADLNSHLMECASIFINADLERPERVNKLVDNSASVDNYNKISRLLGFYTISKFFVLTGIKRLHKNIKTTFGKQNHRDSIHTGYRYYVPNPDTTRMTKLEIAALIRQNSDNVLGIPLLTKKQSEKLFRQFAPVWAIKERTESDRLGAPYWYSQKQLAIDITEPTVYTMVSHARINNEVLLQLNYVIWFPSRPLTGPLDLLGGHLDGITWRITLGKDGAPLMQDTMHNCGCYHMFFPKQGIQQRIAISGEEPLLIPASIPALNKDQRQVIYLASGSHYIEGIYTTDNAIDGIEYRFTDYNALRSLLHPTGNRKSMFAGNGIVTGTSRKERWLLWPMGVTDPGAMRQWGHHATAFIGRRHFDEPFLIERYFQVRD